MSLSPRVVVASVALVAAGCMTVRDAWRAQEELQDLGRDDCVRPATNRLDLSRFSLSQLVDFAMTNRPSVVSAALAVEDSRLALKALRADAPVISSTPWLAPKVSVSGGYGAVGVQGKKLTAETEGGSSGSVSFSIPIYDFGRHNASVRKQCEEVLQSELNLIDAGYSVFYDVSSSYFTLLEKCALLAVAQTNETEFALHLERAERRLEAGDATRVDVMQAQLDLAKAREKIVSAQNDVDTAGAEFLKALGVDASHGMRREVLDFPGDPLAFVMRGFPETHYTVQEAFSLARTNSPAMRVSRSKLRAASEGVDYAVSDLLPTISADLNVAWSDPLWVWSWGVTGVQQIFAGFKKTTAVDRAVIALRRAAADVEEAELAVSLNIEKAVAARDTALKALETAAVSQRQAREYLDQCREQYQVGEIGRVEYSSAVNSYITAMGGRVSAFYKEQRAESAIFSLVGIYPVYEEKKLMEVSK